MSIVLLAVAIILLVSDIILNAKNDILKSEISNIKLLQNALNDDSKNLEAYTKDLVGSFNRIRQKDKENVNNLIADLKNLEQKRYDCTVEKLRVRTERIQKLELMFSRILLAESVRINGGKIEVTESGKKVKIGSIKIKKNKNK